MHPGSFERLSRDLTRCIALGARHTLADSCHVATVQCVQPARQHRAVVRARDLTPDGWIEWDASFLGAERECTEGGEALTTRPRGTDTATREPELGPWAWYAVWTHSHCEQSVYDQLIERGFRSFLPIINIWSRR